MTAHHAKRLTLFNGWVQRKPLTPGPSPLKRERGAKDVEAAVGRGSGRRLALLNESIGAVLLPQQRKDVFICDKLSLDDKKR